MSVRELEAKVSAAGIVISRRQLLRHCQSGTFDAAKLPATNNIPEWFVAPASVDKGIADIRVLQEHRARRDPSRHVTSDNDAPENPNKPHADASSHDGTRRDLTDTGTKDISDTTRQDTSRRDATAHIDIFEHPYVKRLEERNEKLEAKYEAQVRRTEEIQMKSQQQIIELQRMTAIGQSQTLADFMLKAKDWLLGQGSDIEKQEATPPPAAA